MNPGRHGDNWRGLLALITGLHAVISALSLLSYLCFSRASISSPLLSFSSLFSLPYSSPHFHLEIFNDPSSSSCILDHHLLGFIVSTTVPLHAIHAICKRQRSVHLTRSAPPVVASWRLRYRHEVCTFKSPRTMNPAVRSIRR